MSSLGFASAEYVAFIDEAGDYNLDKIDPNMPVFATCALTLSVEDYVTAALAPLARLKYQYFGNEVVVLHGHKIRQRAGEFKILKNAALGSKFLEGVSDCFRGLPKNSFVCAAIYKSKLKAQYRFPKDPFYLSLQFLLERLALHWQEQLSNNEKLLCVFEKRGAIEDSHTRKFFEKICGGENFGKQTFPFEIDFRGKHENVVGHQFADLAAYTLARYVETGKEDRKDWKVLKPKLCTSPDGDVAGRGLKIFP